MSVCSFTSSVAVPLYGGVGGTADAVKKEQ